jgi:hypothetical protein
MKRAAISVVMCITAAVLLTNCGGTSGHTQSYSDGYSYGVQFVISADPTASLYDPNQCTSIGPTEAQSLGDSVSQWESGCWTGFNHEEAILQAQPGNQTQPT